MRDISEKMDSTKNRSRPSNVSGKGSDDFYFPLAVKLPGPKKSGQRKVSPRVPLDLHDMFASLPVTSNLSSSKDMVPQADGS